MKTIKQSYTIHASAETVWQALVDPKQIDGWGGGPAVMDEKVGTKFKLWGGDIHGKNTEVIPHKKLVQDWFGGKWEIPSIVTFDLDSKDEDTTEVSLLHEQVPDDEAKDIEEGWKEYYMNPLKDYVENN